MSPHASTVQLNLTIPSGGHHEHDELKITGNELGLANNKLPSLWGVPLKYISLVTLALQNSLLSIVMHYSRVSVEPSKAYNASTAVLMTELLKGIISLVIAFTHINLGEDSTAQKQPRGFVLRCKQLAKEVFSSDCWMLSIPALLYVIQNNLQFIAASNLNAATFQVTYQMKILTTAFFSVLLLRKKLLPSQWCALLFLALGVGIVQIQAGAAKSPAASLNELIDVHVMHASKGFLAVSAACFTSGLAGVYFEMVLKNSPGDLWVRNVQLSLFSLLPAVLPVIFTSINNGNNENLVHGLFRNFGVSAWATVGIQVLGGLVTAMVIKYADNLLKGFATSLSIIISFLASVALFRMHITLSFIFGSSVVLIATWLYNQQPKRYHSVSFGHGVLGRPGDKISTNFGSTTIGMSPLDGKSPAMQSYGR